MNVKELKELLLTAEDYEPVLISTNGTDFEEALFEVSGTLIISKQLDDEGLEVPQDVEDQVRVFGLISNTENLEIKPNLN